MMLQALMADLESRGIVLFLDQGALRYRSPSNALTEADRAVLRARRAELVASLQAREAARALRNQKGEAGPLTPSVAQEMWWRFAGAPEEGKPVALNIGMARSFQAAPARVADAVRTVLERHAALRVGFQAEGETLIAHLNDTDALVIEQEDQPDAQAALASARAFGARLNPILGQWLTRAKVIAMPDGTSLAAISAAHMIADFGSRNIVIQEIQDVLDGKPAPSPSLDYNSFSRGERAFLDGPQGAQLIGYWRDWYAAQPQLRSPLAAIPLQWGNGTRIVCDFTIPRRMMARARALAEAWKVTGFGIHLALYCTALARWTGVEEFPVRVLGDKRVTVETAGTVGLMFCADAVAVSVPREAGFETAMRGIVAAYEAASARRIPSLHFYAPHMVRPGIEPRGFANRIPAVFNYFSVGTARERSENEAGPDAGLPWPPAVTTVSQAWPRASSPVFLHLMDHGGTMLVSLHFLSDVVPAADQKAFTDILFGLYAEMLA